MSATSKTFRTVTVVASFGLLAVTAVPIASATPSAVGATESSPYSYAVSAPVTVAGAGGVAVDPGTGLAYVSSTVSGEPAASVVQEATGTVTTTIHGAAGSQLLLDPGRGRLSTVSDRNFAVYSTRTRQRIFTSAKAPGYETYRNGSAVDLKTGDGFVPFATVPHLDSTGVARVSGRTGLVSEEPAASDSGCGGGVAIDSGRRVGFLATDLHLTRFNLDDRSQTTLDLGPSTDAFPCIATHVPVAVDAESGTVWVAGAGTLYAVDPTTMATIGSWSVAGSASELAVDTATHSVYLLDGSSLVVFDPARGVVDEVAPLPASGAGLAVDSTRHRAVVSAGDTVVVISQRLPAVTSYFGDAQKAFVGDRYPAPLSVRLTRSGQPIVGQTVNFQVQGYNGSFDGRDSVSVTTDTDGLASSPALYAGQLPGPLSVDAILPDKTRHRFTLSVTGRTVPVTAYPITADSPGQLIEPAGVYGDYGSLPGRLETEDGQPLGGRELRIDILGGARPEYHTPVPPDRFFSQGDGSFSTRGVHAGEGTPGPVLVTVEGDHVQPDGYLLSNPDPDRPATDLSVSLSVPSRLTVGTTSIATLTVHNRGQVALRDGDVWAGVSVQPGVRLGTPSGLIVYAREQLLVVDAGALRPGDSRTFTVPISTIRSGRLDVSAGVVSGLHDTAPRNNGVRVSTTAR